MSRRRNNSKDTRRSYRLNNRSLHEWRKKLGGGMCRVMQAWQEGGQWFYRSCEVPTRRSEAEAAEWEWVDSDPAELPMEELQALRAKIFDKYSRRRLPWEHVDQIDQIIKAHPDFENEDETE